jgi:hypothetical protein
VPLPLCCPSAAPPSAPAPLLPQCRPTLSAVPLPLCPCPCPGAVPRSRSRAPMRAEPEPAADPEPAGRSSTLAELFLDESRIVRLCLTMPSRAGAGAGAVPRAPPLPLSAGRAPPSAPLLPRSRAPCPSAPACRPSRAPAPAPLPRIRPAGRAPCPSLCPSLCPSAPAPAVPRHDGRPCPSTPAMPPKNGGNPPFPYCTVRTVWCPSGPPQNRLIFGIDPSKNGRKAASTPPFCT